MGYHTLISADDLMERVHAGDVRVVDCRFSLADPDAGQRAYAAGHVPGAVYAHLEHDLSGPVVPGKTGRHPLPAPEALAGVCGRLGLLPGDQVVAYDAAGGAFAARLWWLLRFVGHVDVAVLDGGLDAWTRAGGALTTDPPAPVPTRYPVRVNPAMIADVETVQAARARAGTCLLDARAADRFRGENETIDPVAGHIPGARSLPFAENLEAGAFRSRAALCARFQDACAGAAADQCIAYCGSGVTACHLILAAAHAGHDGIKLYPGSWSEWITDPARPVATGES